MKRRTALTIAFSIAATLPPLAARAQNIEHDRGKIVSIDMNNLTMEFQDPKGRSTTRRFSKDAEVKFTDGKGFFRNPSVFDLRAPMYVHYTFTDDIIQSFDVVELGYNPATPDVVTTVRKEQGVPRTVTGTVWAYDASVRQVAVDHGGTRETFQLTSQSDTRVTQGDKVQLRTEWSGQRELVVEFKVLSRSEDQAPDDRRPRDRTRRRD